MRKKRNEKFFVCLRVARAARYTFFLSSFSSSCTFVLLSLNLIWPDTEAHISIYTLLYTFFMLQISYKRGRSQRKLIYNNKNQQKQGCWTFVLYCVVKNFYYSSHTKCNMVVELPPYNNYFFLFILLKLCMYVSCMNTHRHTHTHRVMTRHCISFFVCCLPLKKSSDGVCVYVQVENMLDRKTMTKRCINQLEIKVEQKVQTILNVERSSINLEHFFMFEIANEVLKKNWK